jgi:hypothetical protein
MARRSPLVVGALVVAVAVIAVEVAVVLRPRRHEVAQAQAVEEPPPPEVPPPPAPPLPPAVPPPRRLAVAPPPQPAAAPPPAVPVEQPAPDAAPPPDTRAVLKKRALLIADHNIQVIRDADEKAFATMDLPEETRTAIRRINDDYTNRKRDQLAHDEPFPTGPDQLVAGPNAAEADRLRQEALDQLLGSDAGPKFRAAETSSAHDIRIQSRRTWLRSLQNEAPLPPGVTLPSRGE